jgi:hypothetical protein
MREMGGVRERGRERGEGKNEGRWCVGGVALTGFK